MVDLGKFHHGIHPSRACRSCPTDARPPHLEVVYGRGAANAQGSGAGLILTSPDRVDVEYALKFGFQASNNEVEYEVVIARLNLAHSMEVDPLYLKKVRELLKKFIRVQVKHVQRAENSRADALAKLATASQEDLGKLIPIEHLPEPSINIDNGEVSPVMLEPS